MNYYHDHDHDHDLFTIPEEELCCAFCIHWDADGEVYAKDGRVVVKAAQCLAAGTDDRAPYADVSGPEALVFTQPGSLCPHFQHHEENIVDLRGMAKPPAEAGRDYPGSLGA